MPRIRKKEICPHLVIPDTSILWIEDKSFVVDPKFDDFWSAFSKDYKLELVIPKVVQGELVFQQATSAIKSMKKISQEIDKIIQITEKKYSHRITEYAIKEKVQHRFTKWLVSKGGNNADIPIKIINWQELVNNAIWRLPPFEFDSKNDENEKGFRDSLILETIINICKLEKRDIRVAFLCKDRLLKETAQKKLKTDKKFNVYESIGEFTSYLKLTKEEFEEQFRRSIIKRATNRFFSKKDDKCLYIRENLRNRLKEEYKKYFDNPEESEGLSFKLASLGQSAEKWKPLENGVFWIGNAQFLKKDQGYYYWENIVTYVCQYRETFNSKIGRTLLTAGMYQDRVLILPFHITWRAKVYSDARFHDISLEGTELKENIFQEITEEQRKHWNLEKY